MFDAANVFMCGNGFEGTDDVAEGRGRPCACPFQRGARAGDHKGRPYGFVDNDNSMKMIGHDDKCIHRCRREFVWQLVPPFGNQFPGVVEDHFVIVDFAKETFPPLRHNGDVIPSRLRIIVSLQASGFSMEH